MINRLKNLEANFSISSATILIAVLTLLAKLVGLYRERLLATHIGVGQTLDIYYASFRVPDFIFNLLVLGTLSVAFIPVFSKYLLTGRKTANELANTILSVSFTGMFVVCLAIFIFARPISRILVPGFDQASLDATVTLTRLLLVSPLIFTVANITGAMLQSMKKFLAVTFAASLYNAGIILGYYFFYENFGLLGLGMGVILGAVLLLCVQLPGIYSLGFRLRPQWKIRDKGVKEFWKLFVPRIFGLDSSQLSLLVGSTIGSLLAAGSITILNLANNLQFVPISIFALSTAIAAFPALSEYYAKRDIKSFIQTLENSLIQIMFIMIPMTILMLIFRAYIVRLVYGAGKFNWTDTILTFQTLGVFAFALLSQSIIPLLARAFYSMLNTKTPVVVGLISMALNIVLSFQLAKIYGVTGIALGYVIANVLNCVILFLLLHRRLNRETGLARKVRLFDRDLIYAAAKIIFASICMGMVSYSLIYVISPFVNTRTVIGILLQSGIAAVLGGLTYLAVTFLMGLDTTTKMLRFFDAFLNPKSKRPEA